MRKSIFVKHS